jgi:hypothetical protein
MNQIIPGLWAIDEIGGIVSCYLWEWSGGLTLIDTGMPASAHTLLDALTAKGHALHNVRRIIVTHGDVDHAGSAAKLKRATGALMGCHSVEKVLLEHPAKRVPASVDSIAPSLRWCACCHSSTCCLSRPMNSTSMVRKRRKASSSSTRRDTRRGTFRCSTARSAC